MQAAQIFAGATFAAFLGARMFKGRTQRVQAAITVVYLAGVLGFIAYVVVR